MRNTADIGRLVVMAKGENSDLDLAVDKKKSPLLGMLINIGIGLLLVAVNLGVTYFLIDMTIEKHIAQMAVCQGGSGATAGEVGTGANAVPIEPPVFVSLAPAFVVNIGEIEQGRFLQTEIEVLTRDPEVGEAIEKLMPMIRSNILLILGQQTIDTISTREGMDALQQEVLREVENILETYGGKSGVEKVYFTSFVTQ